MRRTRIHQKLELLRLAAFELIGLSAALMTAYAVAWRAFTLTSAWRGL